MRIDVCNVMTLRVWGQVLDATHGGSHVVLCEHSNTERGFLVRLAGRLESLLGGQLELIVSQADRDPITVV